MTPGYQLTETAEAELDEILRYVVDRDGLDRALYVHDRFVHAFELLTAQPGSGTTRPDLTGGHVRWWFVFKWVVIYDPERSPISILRVIHGARDLERLLRTNH